MTESFRLLERLYVDAETRRIWSEDATIAAWLRVEAELARAQAAEGLLSEAEAEAIDAACDVDRIQRDELWRAARNVGYPILGLVRAVAARLPDGPNGRVHFGATTQDIMDTALALQLVESCRHLDSIVAGIGDALAEKTIEHRDTVIAARTHGQQAVPTTLGAKLAVYLDQVIDCLGRFERSRRQVGRVSLSGAGGTNAAMGSRGAAIRRRLAAALGLDVADIPWHVGRDRITELALACGMAAAVCVRFAREVVDLSRSEIAEVAERSGHHRGASSTMPQKSNPITAESIIGFGIAAEVEAAGLLRTIEAANERSAGEWQAEWLLIPQVIEHTASALVLLRELVSSLEIDAAAMERNLGVDGGLLMSEAAMMHLAPTLGREVAHDLVYEAVRGCRDEAMTFAHTLTTLLEREGHPELAGHATRPDEYLGEAREICAAAVDRWTNTREEHA